MIKLTWVHFFLFTHIEYKFEKSHENYKDKLLLCSYVKKVAHITLLTRCWGQAIFWQCSPGTVETQRLYPLHHGEHCQKIAVSNPTQAGQRFTWSKTWCDRQQLWKAVITGDTVTRLSIPIRSHGKSPEEGQRWNLAET